MHVHTHTIYMYIHIIYKIYICYQIRISPVYTVVVVVASKLRRVHGPISGLGLYQLGRGRSEQRGVNIPVGT